jgi:hypothetical protein
MNTALLVIAVLAGVGFFLWAVFALLNSALKRDELIRAHPERSGDDCLIGVITVMGAVAGASGSH